MSGTWPTTPAPARITWRSTAPTRVSVSHSLVRQARTRGAQRFSFAATWPPMPPAEFRPVWAFALAQRGQAETFSWVVPQCAPRGDWAGSPVVDGAAEAGYALSVRGLTAGATALAGDFLQVAGHSKVYVVTADATADGSGLAELAIYPALMATPADGAAITVRDIAWTLALAADVQETEMTPGVLHSYGAEFVEVPG